MTTVYKGTTGLVKVLDDTASGATEPAVWNSRQVWNEALLESSQRGDGVWNGARQPVLRQREHAVPTRGQHKAHQQKNKRRMNERA